MHTESTVGERGRALRDVVNEPEIHEKLSKNKHLFRQLCASMDAIGDTDLAISFYLGCPPIQELGHRYLLAYGLLQVLFVQQDAVKHAAEAVGMNYQFPTALLQNRDIRNAAIGHPTKREDFRRKVTESFGISQMSLSSEGFTLCSFDWTKPKNFHEIRFREMIDRQQLDVVTGIDAIIRHLRALAGELS